MASGREGGGGEDSRCKQDTYKRMSASRLRRNVSEGVGGGCLTLSAGENKASESVRGFGGQLKPQPWAQRWAWGRHRFLCLRGN